MIFYLIVTSLSVFLVSQFLPGVKVDNYITAILIALVLGIVNIFIKPILVILTLPINILTLGLFTFVINGFLIILVSKVISGFFVQDLLTAIIFSLLLTFVSSILNKLAK